MPRLRDWLTAARPLAQANIAVPLLFGQAVGWAMHGAFDLRWLAYLAVYGVVDQLYIVFANDYADRESDGSTRTPFSGGSGVIQAGRISASSLRRAAIAMAVALVALASLVFAVRPLLLAVSLVAIALLHAYSFPPLRLSQRGGGEWLQALGVGAVLPFAGYYAQTGRIDLPAWALVPSVLAGLAGNLLTAVPDVDGDRRAGKRTFAVRRGERAAVIACSALLLAVAVLATVQAHGTPPFLAPAAALGLAAAARVGVKGADRARSRLLFVVTAGGVQHATFVLWSLALASSC